MNTIKHEVGISKNASEVYEALTNIKGLSSWWTSDVRGDSKVGGIITFHFNKNIMEMKVVAQIEGQSVVWESVGGYADWEGTKITFDLKETGKQTLVNFEHSGWKDSCTCVSHCNTKWAVFLISLKDYLEKGEGNPFPNDIQINHS
jgi:uncharacterized protein YndB with AHSA1/START domain